MRGVRSQDLSSVCLVDIALPWTPLATCGSLPVAHVTYIRVQCKTRVMWCGTVLECAQRVNAYSQPIIVIRFGCLRLKVGLYMVIVSEPKLSFQLMISREEHAMN